MALTGCQAFGKCVPLISSPALVCVRLLFREKWSWTFPVSSPAVLATLSGVVLAWPVVAKVDLWSGLWKTMLIWMVEDKPPKERRMDQHTRVQRKTQNSRTFSGVIEQSELIWFFSGNRIFLRRRQRADIYGVPTVGLLDVSSYGVGWWKVGDIFSSC